MKAKMIFALVLLVLLVLIGCTGCDSEIGAIDLSRNVEVITTALGWRAQEKYEWDNEELELLMFEKNGKDITAFLRNTEEQIGTATVSLEGTGPVLFCCEDVGDYEMRITATESSDPVLTLTSVQNSKKMYFSMNMNL